MTDPAPAPVTSTTLPAQTTVTLGTAAVNTLKGLEADVKAAASELAHPLTTVEDVIKALKADEAKAKADALASYKKVFGVVVNRSFYIGAGMGIGAAVVALHFL